MRALVIVLDGVGCGELPDAKDFGDCGADTLGHLDRQFSFKLPALEKIGLGNISQFRNFRKIPAAGCWGKMAEQAPAKDTVAGHWEMMGVVVKKPFALFPDGFPQDLINEFLQMNKLSGILGNCTASGTEIIRKFGQDHLQTGFPIVYTSADSVLQIAAHIGRIPPERLYEICEQTRKLADRYNICRVIARPFDGREGNFFRIADKRKDFTMEPFQQTVLDFLTEHKIATIGVGKIGSIFAGRGISESISTKNNLDGLQKISRLLSEIPAGFIFVNLVDFDMLYGHRNDAQGFVNALIEFDEYLQKILQLLKRDDLLIICADHGCDPFFSGTDHTREYVPLLVYSRLISEPKSLGVRKTFADIGATLLDFFKIKQKINACGFWKEINAAAS